MAEHKTKTIQSLFLANTRLRTKNTKVKATNASQDRTFIEALTKDLSENSWSKVDMNKVITDSWNMEKSDLNNLEVNIAPDFLTPKRQVELLENTSNELNLINSRVTQTLLQYETINNQDDVFQLLEEDDEVQFTSGFDRKSIMEESKGKAKVLIIDYNKLGMERERVLNSLKEWFEEMKNDAISGDNVEDDKEKPSEDINIILQTAHTAKEKLMDIHTELIEYVHQHHVKRTSSLSGGRTQAEQTSDTVAKLTKDLENAVNQAREAEGKAFSLEKMLERKEDELKFYRQNDNTKTSQLKEELFLFQQQAQEKDAELQRELKRTKIQLEKAQQQLDLWVVEMQTKERQQVESIDFKKMDPEEFKEMHSKSELAKRRLQAQLKLLQEQLNAQETMKEKEIQMVKAQKEEEFNNRILKLKAEQREQYEKLKEEWSHKVQATQEDYQNKLDSQIRNVELIYTEKDSKKMTELLRKTYEEKLRIFKENASEEVTRLRQEIHTKENEVNSEWEAKLHLTMDAHQAEKQKMIAEAEARLKRELSDIKQELESRQLVEQIAISTNSNQLKKTLGSEIKELQSQLSKRESLVKELVSKVELLSELVSREYNKIEKEISDQKEKDNDDKQQKSLKASESDTKVLFLQEKKKAVELAQHRMKLEKEAAISALVSKFEYEKEMLLEQEKKKYQNEKKQALEQTKQEILLDKETTEQLLHDELQALKQELEKARYQREKSFDVNEELKAQRLKYEKITADMKAKYESNVVQETNVEKTKDNGLEKVKEQTRTLESKLSQITAENDYLRALAQRVKPVTQAERPPTPKPLASIVPQPTASTSAASIAPIEESTGNVQLVMQLDTSSEAVMSRNVSNSTSNSRASTARGKQADTTQKNNWTADDARRLLEMDNRIEQLKEKLSKQNADSIETLLQAQREHNQAVKQLVEMNEQRRRYWEDQKDTMEQRVAILLIENERIRKGQLSSDSADKSGTQSAEEVERASKVALLDKALKEKSELEIQKFSLLQQLEGTKKLLETAEASRQELQSLVKSLEWKLITQQTDNTNKAQRIEVEEQLKKIQEGINKERQVLKNQIAELEGIVTYEKDKAKHSVASMQAQLESERQAVHNLHNTFVKGMTDTYEKRLKGLTEALTACLNDPDLVEELKRDNEEAVKNTQLLNQRDMARVMENMRRLEEEHKLSLVTLQNNNRSELQKVHKAIERLKHEFAVVIEEEKMSLLENEQNERNVQVLDKVKAELESSSEEIQGKNDTQKIVEYEIKAVSTLYSSMLAVLKNRRDFANSLLLQKKHQLGTLHDEMLQKSQVLLASKDQLFEQEKTLVRIKSDKMMDKLQEEQNVIELKVSLRDNQELALAFKAAYKESEKTITDLMHRINNTTIMLDENKRTNEEQLRTIEELQQQVQIYKKQQEASEVALAALRYQAQKAATSMAAKMASMGSANVATVPSSHPPIEKVNLPVEIQQILLENANQEPNRERTKLVEHVWTRVERHPPRNYDEKQKKDMARQMVMQDQILRAQKVSITFAKLHEKLKLKHVQKELATVEPPDDKLTRALQRMELRHQLAIAKWEEKKKLILENRKRSWMLMMQALSDVVATVPFVSGIDLSNSSSDYERIIRSPQEDTEYLIEIPKRQESYPLMQYRPYGPYTELTPQYRTQRTLVKSASSNPPPHLKPLFDTGFKSFSSYDLILHWPGIEGKRIVLLPHSTSFSYDMDMSSTTQEAAISERPISPPSNNGTNLPASGSPRVRLPPITSPSSSPRVNIQTTEKEPPSATSPLPPLQTPQETVHISPL